MTDMTIWTAEIERIADEFNRRMSIIIAVEWVAFGLSMVALAMLVVIEIKNRRYANGKHHS